MWRYGAPCRSNQEHVRRILHPSFLAARCVARLDYLRSFPHQATFPACLDPDEANLERFLAGPVVDRAGNVAQTEVAPISAVLTPAACYHLYQEHEGKKLAQAVYLTTSNTCFRRETVYQPLRRQWSFTMREVVCIGIGGETAEFLDRARSVVDTLVRLLDVPTWAAGAHVQRQAALSVPWQQLRAGSLPNLAVDPDLTVAAGSRLPRNP